MKVFYKIDDGPEILWLDVIGEDYPQLPQITLPIGDHLLLRTTGSTSRKGETYKVRELNVEEVTVLSPSPIADPSVAPSHFPNPFPSKSPINVPTENPLLFPSPVRKSGQHASSTRAKHCG